MSSNHKNCLAIEDKKVHPDQQYITGLIQGDSAVIHRIFEHFYPQVESYTLNNRGTVEDAKDLFNESLKIVYLQGKDGLQLHSSFIGYFKTICKRRWINELKRRKRFTPEVEDQPEAVSDENLGKSIVEQEKQLLFRKHFQRLPDRCRQMLELSFEGLNYREVSEKIGLNYSFVRRRVNECIQKLMETVKSDPIFRELNNGHE